MASVHVCLVIIGVIGPTSGENDVGWMRAALVFGHIEVHDYSLVISASS
jgi:hypothetical protein